MPRPDSSPSRYGWVIVGAMLMVQTVSSGFGFYNMSVYMSHFTRALDAPLADVSFAVSLFFIAGGVAGIYVAKLLDRLHVRWIMVGGAIVSGFALAAVGFADALWQLYLLFVVFGVGNTGVSIVVATTLITQWFPGANRAIALSVASTGLSLGGVLLTPLSAYLLNSWGLEGTMPWLGVAFVVLIGPVALLLVRPAPSAPHGAPAATDRHEWAYGAAVRTRFFVCLALGYVLIMGAQVGGIAHLFNRVDELVGFAIAANAVQVLTIASITGRIVGGWLVMRVSIRAFTLCNLMLQIAGLVAIGFARGPVGALAAAALFGISVGNLLMLQPLWLADAFPGRVYPRVFALANALSVVGVAAGPFMMGLAYDVADYRASFVLAALTSLLAAVVIVLAGSAPIKPQEPKLA